MKHKPGRKIHAETNIPYWIPKADFNIKSLKSYIEIITDSILNEGSNEHVYSGSTVEWEGNSLYVGGTSIALTPDNSELGWNFETDTKLNSLFFRLTWDSGTTEYASYWEFELKQKDSKILILDDKIIEYIDDYNKDTGEVLSFGEQDSLEDVIGDLFSSEGSWNESYDEGGEVTITVDLKKIIPRIQQELVFYLEDIYTILEFFEKHSYDTTWKYTDDLAGDLLSGIITHGNKKSLSLISSLSINNIIEILRDEQEDTEDRQVTAVKDVTLDYFKSFSTNVLKGVENSQLYFLYVMWSLLDALEQGDIEEDIKIAIINNELPDKLSDWEF